MSQKKSFTSSFSALPGKEKGTLCYAIQARLSAVESACRDKGQKIFSLPGKTFENISSVFGGTLTEQIFFVRERWERNGRPLFSFFLHQSSGGKMIIIIK
jgi:hypothetical protein